MSPLYYYRLNKVTKAKSSAYVVDRFTYYSLKEFIIETRFCGYDKFHDIMRQYNVFVSYRSKGDGK